MTRRIPADPKFASPAEREAWQLLVDALPGDATVIANQRLSDREIRPRCRFGRASVRPLRSNPASQGSPHQVVHSSRMMRLAQRGVGAARRPRRRSFVKGR